MSELYRCISVRMWGDKDFRGLSRAEPNAQSLWQYLLTGPHTTPFPGLFTATQEGLAASLKWPLDGFQKALAELTAEGFAEGERKVFLEADWDAGVVWIKGALAHNEPNNPNVLKSWAKPFSIVPECDLKDRAFEHLKAFAKAKSKGFEKAFTKAFEKSSPKPSSKPPRNVSHQEQEQQQEQEQSLNTPPVDPEGGDGVPAEPAEQQSRPQSVPPAVPPPAQTPANQQHPFDDDEDDPRFGPEPFDTGRAERQRDAAALAAERKTVLAGLKAGYGGDHPELTFDQLRKFVERCKGMQRDHGVASLEAVAKRCAEFAGPGRNGWVFDVQRCDPWRAEKLPAQPPRGAKPNYLDRKVGSTTASFVGATPPVDTKARLRADKEANHG